MVKALRCLFSRQGKGQRPVPWRNETSFPCLSLHVKPEAPCVRAWRQSPCWPCTRPVPVLVPGPYTLERKAVLPPHELPYELPHELSQRNRSRCCLCPWGAAPGVVQGCREELLGRDRQPAQVLVLHTALPAQSPSRTLLPFSLSAPGVPGTVQRVVPGLALSPWTQKPMTELSEQAQGTKSGAWGQNGARRSQSLKHSCKKSLRLRSACPCADAPGQAQAALHLRP